MPMDIDNTGVQSYRYWCHYGRQAIRQTFRTNTANRFGDGPLCELHLALYPSTVVLLWPCLFSDQRGIDVVLY